MPSKVASYSKLTVSPLDAGTPVSKGPKVPKFPTSPALRPKSDKKFEKDFGKPTSVVEESIPVYEYDSTVYDTEITGSGATSAYPIILATMPFKNLYKSGELTNFGQLYEIQNELRDITVEKADQLVSNYLQSYPNISASLEQTYNENLGKYNELIKVLPQVYRLKESLISTADITSLTLQQLDSVNDLASTTAADFAPSSKTSTRTSKTKFSSTSTVTSTLSSGGGNLSLGFSDDDVQKYDNDSDVVTRLTEKLLGVNRPTQLKTTRQYQLLKAALAQCVEGRSFSDVEDDGDYVSPYESLKTYDIATIYNITSKKIKPIKGFYFAKKTLDDAADILVNKYLPTKDYPTSYAFLTDLSNSGLFYQARLDKNRSGVYSVPESATSVGNFFNRETYLYGLETIPNVPAPLSALKTLPVLSLNNDYYVAEFIDQIIPTLAAEIASLVESFPTLPPSIDPYTQTAVDVPSTQNDDIRLIAVSDDGQKIFLFDNDLSDRVGTYASPLSTVMLFDIDKIQKMKGDIDSIRLSLQSMVEKRKQLISNQCALTITSIFYKKLYNFFATSILGRSTALDSATDADTAFEAVAEYTAAVKSEAYSALSIIMFARASIDQFAAARLYRIIFDNENEITHLIDQGEAYDTEDASIYNFIEDLLTTPDGRDTDISYDLRGDLLTGRSDKDNRSAIFGKDVFNTGFTGKKEQTFEKEDARNIIKELYSKESIFNTVCRSAVDEIISQYPSISSNPKIVSKIRFGFFHMLLYYVRKLKIRATAIAKSNSKTAGAENTFDISVSLEWQKEGALFIADSFDESLRKSAAKDLSFTNFRKEIGDFPSPDQIQAGSEEFFRRIRGHVKYSLQITQDIKALVAYQLTVLNAQSNVITSLTATLNKVTDLYSGNKTKASQILSRYGTVESITEILYQANRNLSLIPGTSITTSATRSQNYRSIVKMAFKNYIPKKDNFLLCLVGVPYGHLERLRLAQTDRIYYYGCDVFADSSQSDVQNKVDYDFPYYAVSTAARPNTAGPYLSTIANLYDDVLSTRIAEKMGDGAISIMRLSDVGVTLDVLSRDEANPKTQVVDFPATIVQSALQSYVEDIYGLYPRYASTKGKRLDSYPEESTADAVLQFNNIENKTDEQKLIYARLKSTIMMHRLFMTTKMVDDLEASPLFDKIHYVLIDGNNFKDIISEFYTKVEV
jgi:hypothetical protein